MRARYERFDCMIYGQSCARTYECELFELLGCFRFARCYLPVFNYLSHHIWIFDGFSQCIASKCGHFLQLLFTIFTRLHLLRMSFCVCVFFILSFCLLVYSRPYFNIAMRYGSMVVCVCVMWMHDNLANNTILIHWPIAMNAFPYAWRKT